jgi:hypothetical protein
MASAIINPVVLNDNYSFSRRLAGMATMCFGGAFMALIPTMLFSAGLAMLLKKTDNFAGPLNIILLLSVGVGSAFYHDNFIFEGQKELFKQLCSSLEDAVYTYSKEKDFPQEVVTGYQELNINLAEMNYKADKSSFVSALKLMSDFYQELAESADVANLPIVEVT